MPSSLTIVIPLALVCSTCPPVLVWGTGTMSTRYWAFLGSIGLMTSPEAARYHVSEYMRPGFAWSSSYTLTPVLPFTGFIYLPASPYSFPQQCGSVRVDRSQHSPLATEYWDGREHGGTGISTSCASTTPLGLALAPDSPWEDWPRPGTLGHTAEGVLTPLSLLMPTFSLDHAPRPVTLPLRSEIDAPLPRVHKDAPVASAPDLSPVTLSAQDHSTSELLRTLSRVAASKPTSWLSSQSHIVYHLVQILGP